MTSTSQSQQSGYTHDAIESQHMDARKIIDRSLTILSFILLGLAILPLGLVLVYVTIKGIGRLNFDLFTEIPPTALQEGGGVGSAIAGTFLVVLIASVISIPFGIGAGVYLSEFSGKKIARWIRFASNVLSGVPSIIMGIFAYSVIVLTMNRFSTLAAGFALALLMVPIIVRTTDEALQLIPQDVRWASSGVGASDYQTVLKVVIPAAIPAVITGTTLAIARAAGETAPIIFTVLFSQNWPDGLFDESVPTLSYLIYSFATAPYDNQQQLAWAASLILVALVFFTSVISRWMTRQQQY
ncbi:MAG: phosphate ABC transporter permease PstA [Oscillatoriales cyanobacterium RM2_1_1]|nr:phosphate ABC transporter permease PstA [Oscillatoriales cyanobacterium RM2_1_1]